MMPNLREHPWCLSYLNDPLYVPVRDEFREKRETTKDTLFQKTFTTEDTIPDTITLARLPRDGYPVNETITFISLATGLNGYAGILHGGATAMLLDDAAGVIIRQESDFRAPKQVHGLTISLSINFHRPVKTPQIVLVKAKTVFSDERRVNIQTEIWNQQDQTLASADVRFLLLEGSKASKRLAMSAGEKI